MRARTKVLIAVAASFVVAGGVATVSVASGSDDTPLEGSELEQASEAALTHTGGGSVVESEAGEGSGAYEVGVLLEDGSVVEVQLDDNFEVIGSGADSESGESSGENEDGGSIEE
jgi:hypothetical protein